MIWYTRVMPTAQMTRPKPTLRTDMIFEEKRPAGRTAAIEGAGSSNGRPGATEAGAFSSMEIAISTALVEMKEGCNE